MEIRQIPWSDRSTKHRKRIEVTSPSLRYASTSYSCDKSTCKSCKLRFKCWTTETLVVELDMIPPVTMREWTISSKIRCQKLKSYMLNI